ncbi:MAG: alpha/beta fold hydrolase [Lachnospiraceae bacterium]|nr:alpha/beta fold hydrolase [Lachnospiraceae bacterium]
MKKTEVRLRENERELYGVLMEPEGKKKYPAVIFSHGYNGSGKDFERMGEYLAQNGVAAFCYDFCGGSVNSRSSMATTDMTIFTEKEDLHGAIQYMKKSGAVDAENIFLFGGSQGGLVSALVAQEAKEDIRGLILLFPAMCIADNWNERFPKEEDIPQVQELWGMNLGKNFFMTLRGFDVYQHIGGYGRSVQVIYGENDPIVSLDYMEKLKTVYTDMKLDIFKGEGHGFSEEGNQRVVEMTLEFVRQKCKN